MESLRSFFINFDIIVINSDTSSYDTSSDDIASSKGSSIKLLKWYDDSTDVEISEFKVSKSATFKAKASKLTTSKFKEVPTLKNPPQTFTVKSPVAIKNDIIDLANVDTSDSIVKKTYGVRKPTARSGAD
ncbi:hypothetical protein Tco_1047821 [Tanacetum coccineum]